MWEISLRPLREDDVALVDEWLHKRHILQWFHDPGDWIEEIAGRHGAYAWIHHFIVMAGGAPIGFCQYYDCYDANAMEDWYDVTKPAVTFSIDYLIGDEAYLGKGYGKAIVGLLTDALARQPQARQVIVKPDKENVASNRALLANGYVFDAERDCFVKKLHDA